VKVIISRGGEHFITPLAFSSLGAENVFTDANEFDIDEHSVSIHLSLSRWADCILVAPASADFIAKMRAGIADSLILTIVLAFQKPTFVAPCMNENMYLNKITQDNIVHLKSTGVNIIEPQEGSMADFKSGKGRLPEPKSIVEVVTNSFNEEKRFEGKKIMVTCGATKEFIDPVRFITNSSSGKMGAEIARVAKSMGANVHIVYGDVKVELPLVDSYSKVNTTEDMFEAVRDNFSNIDILIMAAAPADFKPKYFQNKKLPKIKSLSVEFEETIDILQTVALGKKNQVVVGFALQTEDIKENAIKKLSQKNMDIVVANRETNIGEDVASVIFISKKGNNKELNNVSKEQIAKELLHFIDDYMSIGGEQ
jgi:phosphopantothenoylcysteine decarboxylase/phosphopantothenate--cysteine ligase